ncbi:hypothetical protein [Thiolapillus sp.]|uniref:hypothetical protein n=7 Tax=Thiolapillus sp. TaxID=2017437 RepID=UPI0025FCE236|nr:hypothetical protein [Thiolapillus sp.]
MKILARRLIPYFILLFLPLLASASSVRRVDMAEVAGSAQLVFEGRVIAKHIEHTPGSRAIHTWVKFEILDLIKGQYDQPSIELSFLGGTAGDLSVTVSDMQIPAMGEHGIYFVEDISRPLVNPLYGWDQGHFLVQFDKDLRRQTVSTLGGQPVFGLDLGSLEKSRQELSKGIARGVLTEPQASRAGPLDPGDFKALLRGVVQ